MRARGRNLLKVQIVTSVTVENVTVVAPRLSLEETLEKLEVPVT